MASKEFKKKPVSFTDLVEQSRQEIPPCPDLRFQIRQRLSSSSVEERDSEPSWTQILIQLASFGRVQTGFGIAFATLMVTSYMELKRPEPQTSRPAPQPMFIDSTVNE
jgi:hypothetical protein